MGISKIILLKLKKKPNMNRINIICLGVKDMEKAIRFYRDGLGFQTKEKSNTPDVIFFSTSGTKLELYPLDLLAKDIDKDNPAGNRYGIRRNHACL